MLRTKLALRLIALALVSGVLLSLVAMTAHAEPTTAERRQVAEEVATSVCGAITKIPKLPPSLDPVQLCRTVIVENIDPEGTNSGVRASCAIALSGPAQPAVKFCVQLIDKLLDPARKLFLDKVVPVAQQLACMASSPGAFDCLAQQVHVWLNQSIVSLWQGLLTATTAETTAIDLLDGWRNPGLVSLYSDIGALGAILLLGGVLASLLVSLLLFVVPPVSWRTSLCGLGQASRVAGLVVDRAHHVCRAVSTVVVVEPVAPVQDDGLGLPGVDELVA